MRVSLRVFLYMCVHLCVLECICCVFSLVCFSMQNGVCVYSLFWIHRYTIVWFCKMCVCVYLLCILCVCFGICKWNSVSTKDLNYLHKELQPYLNNLASFSSFPFLKDILLLVKLRQEKESVYAEVRKKKREREIDR